MDGEGVERLVIFLIEDLTQQILLFSFVHSSCIILFFYFLKTVFQNVDVKANVKGPGAVDA